MFQSKKLMEGNGKLLKKIFFFFSRMGEMYEGKNVDGSFI